jgi:release factor glutamine methyltransferase
MSLGPPRARIAGTVQALLQAAVGRIDAFEAELLLSHAIGKSRTWLYAHRTDHVADADAARYDALLARRVQGEPVAYLTGRRGFWAFDLQVSPQTLIPRPETERLVELALERIPPEPGQRLADLGTGSGAIALALAHERRQAQVIATDISEGALEVARGNAALLRLNNVTFRQGDWCAPLAGERFDLIASNPPYIADGDPHLREGDLRHEPARALSSGPEGLDAIGTIVHDAPAHLLPGGWLLIEHGWRQGEAVRALLAMSGFHTIHTDRDLEGCDRVTIGRWSG